MFRITVIISLLSILLSQSLRAQTYENVSYQIVELGARKIEDSARKVVVVPLPEKTKRYVYRVSIFKKDKGVKLKDTLFAQLENIAPEDMKAGDTLTTLIARQPNAEMLDFYIVPTEEDGVAFKERKMYNSCLRQPDMMNFCAVSDTCVGKSLVICLKNKNLKKDLSVVIEVVAIKEGDQPRWTEESRKTIKESLTNEIKEVCYLMADEDKIAFATDVYTKFAARYSDAQVKGFSKEQMTEATEKVFAISEKELKTRCKARKKTEAEKEEGDKKKKKKKKKKGIF